MNTALFHNPARILIVYKSPQADNPSACHAGLGVTAANMAEVLNEHGIHAEAVPVIDGYYIRNGLRANKWPGVTNLIMCAPFFDTAFLRALCTEFPRVQFAVTFHSNVGFLGVDNWSTGVLGEQLALQDHIANFRVAGNCEKFCEAVREAFCTDCSLLPNLYFLHGPIERKRPLWSHGEPLRIGAFGATRVLKNLPTAAWAAQILANQLNADVEFWVSSGRAEGAGSGNVIAGIHQLYRHNAARIRLVEAPWADWLEFRRRTVRRMHLMLQPSFTESFNGVTADGIAEGVPSVVGKAIDWVPSKWIANPDDAVDIARAARGLLRDKNAARDGYRALAKHNDCAIKAWRSFLG
jgi:hypothetical protein